MAGYTNNTSIAAGYRGAGRGAPGFSLTMNSDAFNQLMERASYFVKDMRPAMQEMMRWNQKYNIGQFSLKSTGLYKPLSEKYLKQKIERFGRRLPILVGVGMLANSVILDQSIGAIRAVTPNSFTIGTAIPYAPIHQYGGLSRYYDRDTKRTITIKVPARPFLYWDDYRRKATVAILEYFFVSAMLKAWNIENGPKPKMPPMPPGNQNKISNSEKTVKRRRKRKNAQ